jgi:hypothetical protein
MMTTLMMVMVVSGDEESGGIHDGEDGADN